jgi:exosortase/archaeosortase
MNDDTLLKVFSGIVATAVVGVVYIGYLAIEESNKWEQFKETHECKIVSKVSGTTSINSGVAIGSNGQIHPIITTSVSAGKTAYLCNDGVTYWK